MSWVVHTSDLAGRIVRLDFRILNQFAHQFHSWDLGSCRRDDLAGPARSNLQTAPTIPLPSHDGASLAPYSTGILAESVPFGDRQGAYGKEMGLYRAVFDCAWPTSGLALRRTRVGGTIVARSAASFCSLDQRGRAVRTSKEV